MSDCYYIAGEDDFDPDISPIVVRQPTFIPPKEAYEELRKMYDRWNENQKLLKDGKQ